MNAKVAEGSLSDGVVGCGALSLLCPCICAESGDGMVWAKRRVAELEAELAESLTTQNKEVLTTQNMQCLVKHFSVSVVIVWPTLPCSCLMLAPPCFVCPPLPHW